MRRIKAFPHFLSGFLAAALLFSLGASALAFSGAVSFGGVKVVLAGEQVLAANEGVTAPNGASVPGSVTYTDEKNGGTIYLPLRRISDLLDASVDYDAAAKTVYVGGVPVSTGDMTVSNPNGDPLTPREGRGDGCPRLRDPRYADRPLYQGGYPCSHCG